MTETRITSRQFREDGWNPADETWTYASSDDPTYTFTISAFDATTKYSPGMKVKLTDTGVQYFFITKVVFDDPGSTITVYGGTDYDLSTGAITLPFYSTLQSPLDFPLEVDKWTEETVGTSDDGQASPTQNVWYNQPSCNLVLPIGSWKVYYQWFLGGERPGSAGLLDLRATLSTGSSSESDTEFTTRVRFSNVASSEVAIAEATKNQTVNVATKTTTYANIETPQTGYTSITLYNSLSDGVTRATISYL